MNTKEVKGKDVNTAARVRVRPRRRGFVADFCCTPFTLDANYHQGPLSRVVR